MNKTTHTKLPLNLDEPVNMTALKMLANLNLGRADALANGKAHTPKFHEGGWKIAIETPHGPIGLWSCWLGNQFHLGYPVTENAVPRKQIDKLITRHLGVELAKPVLQVNATSVQEGYAGEDKDPDKPLEVNALGQVIAYRARGPRQWAMYCGPRVSSEEQKPGRVWIEHARFSSTAVEFDLITPDAPEASSVVWYGHDEGGNIYTFPFTFANRYSPDSPTAKSEYLQAYRERFLALASALAQAFGGARAININYGFVLTPTQLEQLGYAGVTWIKGSPDKYLGWREEIVLASRPLASGQTEHLLLRSGNEMVPWSTIRRIPVETPGREFTAGDLHDLLTF